MGRQEIYVRVGTLCQAPLFRICEMNVLRGKVRDCLYIRKRGWEVISKRKKASLENLRKGVQPGFAALCGDASVARAEGGCKGRDGGFLVDRQKRRDWEMRAGNQAVRNARRYKASADRDGRAKKIKLRALIYSARDEKGVLQVSHALSPKISENSRPRSMLQKNVSMTLPSFLLARARLAMDLD